MAPIADATVEIFPELFQSIYHTELPPELTSDLRSWLDLFTGDMAAVATGGMQSLSMIELIGVADGPAALAYANKLSAWLAEATASGTAPTIMGMKVNTTSRPEAFVHDGVPVMEQQTTYDLSTMDETQRMAMEQFMSKTQTSHLFGLDKLLGLAMSTSGDTGARAAIDAARGKQPGFTPDSKLAAALERSKARDESFLFYLNLPAMMPEAGAIPGMPAAFEYGIGFRKGAMVMRMAFPR